MKKVYFALCAMVALATSCERNPLAYNIQATTADTTLNGVTLFLMDGQEKADSAVVTDGKFAFEGTVVKPTIFSIYQGNKRVMLIQEPETVNLEFGDASVVTGGALNSAFIAVNDSIGGLTANVRKEIGAVTEADARQTIIDNYYDTLKQIFEGAITENSDNILGAYFVSQLISVDEVETLEALDAIIAKATLAKDYAPIVAARQQIENKLNTANGKMFVDFKAQDADGKEVSLSDYVGKGNYVLVDFWASWCGPCKAEIPNLRAVYDEYKDKGFVVLGVNVWERSMDAYKKAVEEENMTWPTMFASANQNATTLYGISGIPTIILFAPDGTIVDRVRGENIKKAVDKAYAK